MSPRNHPKQQHYVPKVLLKNFTNGTDKVHVFDKHKGHKFKKPTNISKVAREKAFNDFEFENHTFTIEYSLSDLETAINEVFEKVIKEKSLSNLDHSERLLLASFVSIQSLRVKHFREHLKTQNESLKSWLGNAGFNPAEVKGFLDLGNEEALKTFNSTFILRNADKFAQVLLSHDWLLLRTEKKNPFWIGDNPVCKHNDLDFGPYGNLGLACKGIQIYMPVSEELCLAIWCKRYFEDLQERLQTTKKDVEKIKMLMVMSGLPKPKEYNELLEECDRLDSILKTHKHAKDTGAPIMANEDNVVFLNFQQIAWAYRFIYSGQSDFSFVQKVLKEQPHLKRGHMANFG